MVSHDNSFAVNLWYSAVVDVNVLDAVVESLLVPSVMICTANLRVGMLRKPGAVRVTTPRRIR